MQDSLQRPRKRKMKQVDVESDSDSDVCSSKGFEDSVMEGLKRHKSSEISLRQSGLLERKQFMHMCKLSIYIFNCCTKISLTGQ